MAVKYTKDDFIKKAREIHGDKYDYSKVEYVNSQTKVCIICPEHGEFWQLPASHIARKGCELCARLKIQNALKIGTDQFIQKAREIHGDKYDYSKVEYVNNRQKVCIICPEHGEFWQTPTNHFSGNGCHKCGGRYLETSEWIDLAKKIHGDEYDYSKVDYKRGTKQVCIVCPKHGEFWQKAHYHIQGSRCPECVRQETGDRCRMSYEEFIRKANAIHENKYDYSKVEYINTETKVCIICPEHGEFWQTPHSHLKGGNCPKCQTSHLEEELTNIFINKNINFEIYKKFKWLGRQSLDFYLPQYNIAIECQGRQHFEKVNAFGGEEGFLKTQERDKRKYDLCKEQSIKLLYYTHEHYDTFLGEELIKEPQKLLEKILEIKK